MNKRKDLEQENYEQLPVVTPPVGGVYLANSISQLLKKFRRLFSKTTKDPYSKVRVYKIIMNAGTVSYLIRRVP